MNFGLLLNLFSLLAVQTCVRGQKNQDIWLDAEPAEGELQEEDCDVSFLQASLHPSLDTSQEHRQRARHGQPRTELHRVQEPLSFFQTDEEFHESATDIVTVDSSSSGSPAPASGELPRDKDDNFPLTPERLALAMFALKFLAVSAVVFKGGSSFVRLLTRKSTTTLCDSSEPPETKTQPVHQRNKLSGVLQQIAQVPMARAEDIEKLLPTGDNAYDCALSKPKQVGKSLRFRARIYGPVSSSDSLVGPVSQEPCVLYRASARCKTDAQGDERVIGQSCKSVDFVAKVENFPDLAFTIRGEEVQMLAMESGYCKKSMTLPSAASSASSLLSMVPHGERALPDDHEITFEEWALRIGEVVTFVGDLHRDAFGALLLWPAPKTPASANHQSAAEINAAISDHEHVTASDNQQLEVSTEDISFSGDRFALV